MKQWINATLVNVVKTSQRWTGTKYTALIVPANDQRLPLITNKHVYAQYHKKGGACNLNVNITYEGTNLLTIKESDLP